MFKTFIGAKNCRLLCFLGFVLSLGFLQAQEIKTNPDVEKVYLHTDNSIYAIGDDLFYKVYNVRASNNILFDNSNIVYVELISSNQEIIARNKTNIEIGLGHGDFKLTDSIGVKPGVYQLRAYTNWNRNFGDQFVFKKNIEIIDVFESNSKVNSTKKEDKRAKSQPQIQPITTNSLNNYKVDFFPEGGSLLENVASIVGFKAVDANGSPIEITGDIFDSDNQLITSFSSVHDGMGKFQILPMEGKKYYAKIKTLQGGTLQENLPNVQKQGYLLSYKALKGRNIISILTNQATLLQNPNAAVTVICKAKGISYLENGQTITQTVTSFELEKNATPDGISQITLLDSNSKPHSERLIIIEKEKDFQVTVATDKPIYKPNEKAIVTISSKSNDGMAKSGSFSLSVTDTNGIIEEKEYDSNICSYFLMESDIKGKVHQPGYYFDINNPKKLDHLDNLLLTQGWRDFLWKTIPKATDGINYIAEKGFTITGRVKQVFSDKAKTDYRVGLVLLNKKHINTFKTKTDSTGSFKFENIMFSDKTDMSLNSRDEKGKFKGEIVLDSVGNAPVAVSFKKEPINWSESTRIVVDNIFKKYTAFGVKSENMLKEVEIKVQNKKYTPVLYGIPDYKYMIDKKEAKKKNNAAELIEDQCFGVIRPNFSMEVNSYFDPESTYPMILIDGNQAYEAAELMTIAPEDIIKIEVASGKAVEAVYGRGVVISVFTNGNRSKIINEYFHTVKVKIDGFYTARVFYSPTPEQAELENKLAVRNTIYWNPYVHPDKTGNATVNYYNTKVETKVKVALEGITATGIPVVKKTYYEIKK
ncbi:hypothetical protein [Flavobacterium eburneipallidum]|uniref:hypothetical protein n=1 Tax=Flavobacterium eburneipallidum TaxID=3003263 RepID=UPI0024822907|nr:hypothetical protein [Flavobacterium eburneipallidum]